VKNANSRPYLEYLLDRAAAGVDFARDEDRRGFLDRMLGVAAKIPPATRDQFMIDWPTGARVRRGGPCRNQARGSEPQTSQGVETARGVRLVGDVRPAEKGLIWAILHEPQAAQEALAQLEEQDFEGLAAGAVLRAAWTMADWPSDTVTDSLVERLSTGEAALIAALRAQSGRPAPPTECARALRRLRYERERAELQCEIDRLQDLGPAHTGQIEALWARKKDLSQRLDALDT
jgi:hypothetical protein